MDIERDSSSRQKPATPSGNGKTVYGDSTMSRAGVMDSGLLGKYSSQMAEYFFINTEELLCNL